MGGKSGGEVIIVVRVVPSQYRCVDSPVSDILHLVGRAGAPAENPPRRHADRLNIEPRALQSQQMVLLLVLVFVLVVLLLLVYTMHHAVL
jgi:hypothetical protein